MVFSRTPLRSCYKILHMPRQHSYRTMWNISWRSLHYNLDESKIEFPSNNDREIVREMGPSRPQVNPCDTNPVSVRSFTNMSAHYSDVMMSEMASQITGVSIAYLTVCFRRRSKKTSKLRVTGLCEGNSQVIGEFPTQMASNAENVSIWWRYHKTFWFEHQMLIFSLLHLYIYFCCKYWRLSEAGRDNSKNSKLFHEIKSQVKRWNVLSNFFYEWCYTHGLAIWITVNFYSEIKSAHIVCTYIFPCRLQLYMYNMT